MWLLPTLSLLVRLLSAMAPPSRPAQFSEATSRRSRLDFGPMSRNVVIYAAWSSPTGLPAETSIERFVTIGAYSLRRSCTIEPECYNRSAFHSILEPGSVVPPGRRMPTGELWAGNPARFVRTLTHEEKLEIPKLAVAINGLSRYHFSEFLPYTTAYLEVEKFKKSLGIPV